MVIRSAEYVRSSPTVDMCPTDGLAEYAFIGRSNVGKSSLINMLCNRRGLAKTSATPGKTIYINHFIVNGQWYLVDLPGYGYAKRSKSARERLEQMIRTYILQRKQLITLFVLIDIRHEQQKIDRDFIDWLGVSQVPFSIVFTKADKISATRARTNVEAYMEELRETWEELPLHFITSSVNGTGRDDILDYIESINDSLMDQ